ncbi:tRNA methyltransferase 10 homolog A-like [Scylla paramamosain]|uniref:tRNA methyltransferase 10 homolog A-like n=1 Tax=Scylla paramamosain TaxID=85552 RepID=UPI0030838A48
MEVEEEEEKRRGQTEEEEEGRRRRGLTEVEEGEEAKKRKGEKDNEKRRKEKQEKQEKMTNSLKHQTNTQTHTPQTLPNTPKTSPFEPETPQGTPDQQNSPTHPPNTATPHPNTENKPPFESEALQDTATPQAKHQTTTTPHPNTPEATHPSETNTGARISKRQMKRALKHARWLEGKADRRRRQREKEKKKRLMGLTSSGPSRKALKRVRMSDSACKVRVAIDMSLESLMDDRRLGQCVRQIGRCYSANRRALQPLQLYVTSFQGRPRSQMATQVGYENWDVNFQSQHYRDIFAKPDIVYLTSESANTLTEIDETKAYVIGGLVDYNRLKGHCLGLAEREGVATARLPLSDYLDMKSRKVLTIDQVFQVLVGVVEGCGWKEVLLSTLPLRKGARGKDNEGEEEEEEEVEEEEVEEMKTVEDEVDEKRFVGEEEEEEGITRNKN